MKSETNVGSGLCLLYQFAATYYPDCRGSKAASQ